ncbi:hypothetical protein KJ765_02070 [Candidatus Micrarchaeota archaeon]|nr:hypothetical protein [Candidatus Micrarchaeota archaeon]
MAADIVTRSFLALETAFENSVQTIMSNVLELIPNVIAAIIIFVIGYIIARIIAHIVERFLDFVRFEKFLAEHGAGDALGKIKVSAVLTKIAKYYILLIFLQAGVSLLYLGTISTFLNFVLIYAPVFVGAVLLLVIAAVLGEVVKEKVLDTAPKSNFVRFVGTGSKALVVFFGLVMALATLGFNTDIITASFVTLLQGIVYGVALAVGISFGLGGQDDAKSMIKEGRKKLSL